MSVLAATPGPAWSSVLNTIQNKVKTRYNFIYHADLVPCLPTYVGLAEPQPYRHHRIETAEKSEVFIETRTIR